MVKLAKYLKPFLPGVVLALALLFVQAMSDLNLPNMMSDIVNIGIQQSGIEHASPEAISPQGFELITAYMTETDRDMTVSAYRSVAADDTNEKGKTYRSLYPGMIDTVYVLSDTNKTLRASLDDAFGDSAYRFVNILKEFAQASGQASGDTGTDYTFDTETAYRAHAMLSQMPGGGVTASDNEDDAIGAAYGKQTGAMFAKAFYTELGVDTGRMQTNYIIKIGLYMLLIAFIGGAATVLVGLLAPRIASGAARNLRRDIFSKVENFSHHEFDQFSSASLITRCTNDVTQVQMLVGMGLRMMCYAPILGIGGIIMALGKSVSMSWIIALAVVVLIGLVMVIVAIAMPRFKIIQKLIDKLNKVARENLSGLMVIRAFGTQQHEQARFEAANTELTDTNLFVQRVMAFMMPAITFIMNGVTLLIVWVGANQIASSAMQIGDMLAFMQYAMQIIMSFMMISMMFIFVPRAAVSGDRIAEVLSTEPDITDPEQPKAFNLHKKGLVEFKNVHFRYHDAEQDALSNICFTARPGETTAIIGATGSGKSTVANLLMRFYDVTQGSITVDGVDIREVRQADLREKIGYVPQKGVLMTGTIASNIRYGQPDATEAEVAQAAAVAQAADFIEEMPEQYDAEIAQGGTNVSGGQKQRLSIARALAKKPEILVFDDSFSALDFKTDAKLRKALKTHTAEATVLVVAQRVGTIMHAEQIIVLDEGKIVGIGTHDELLNTCPAYHEIASSQLSNQQAATESEVTRA